MPRRGRIQLVGMWEARERDELAEELKTLASELHRAWRQSQCDASEDIGGRVQYPSRRNGTPVFSRTHRGQRTRAATSERPATTE